MGLFDQLHRDWQELLFDQRDLLSCIESKIDPNNIAPAYENILAAYKLAPSKITIVIIGQDPYPTPGYAHGLAFSVDKKIEPLPASLRNILKEVASDCGSELATDGDLHRWADQGVFLLNRVLTTTPGTSLAHEKIGWQSFTQRSAQILGALGSVGIFWGKKADELSQYFAPALTIRSVHPSPLSVYRGFYGSQPFSTANELLKQAGKEPISW